MAKAKVLKDKQGNTIYPVTDVSLILGLKEGFMDIVEVDTLPTASGQTRGKLYMVPSTETVGEYDRYITKFEDGSYFWKQLTSTTVPSPVVADNLTTDDATKALSAKQGKVLDGKVTQLGQKVGDLTHSNFTRHRGWMTSDSGAYTDYWANKYLVIPVRAGASFKLTKTGNNTDQYAFLASFDSEPTTSFDIIGSRQYLTGNTAEGVIPAGANYIYFLCRYNSVDWPLPIIEIDGIVINDEIDREILQIASITKTKLPIDEVGIDIVSENLGDPEGVVDGKYINNSGGISSNSSWSYIKIPVTPGVKYTFGGFYLGRNAYYAFYDANNTKILYNEFSDPNGRQSPVTTGSAPVNAAYLYIDIKTANSPSNPYSGLQINEGETFLPYDEYIEGVTKILNDGLLGRDIDLRKKYQEEVQRTPKLNTGFINSGYIKYSDGTLNSGGYKTTDFIKVFKDEVIKVNEIYGSSSVAVLAAYSTNDASGYIKEKSVIGTGESVSFQYKVLDGVSYIRLCSYSTYSPNYGIIPYVPYIPDDMVATGLSDKDDKIATLGIVRSSLFSKAQLRLYPQTKLPCVSFQFDDIPANDADVVSLFESYGLTCAFAFIASESNITNKASIYRDYQRRGFQIMNHSVDGTIFNTTNYTYETAQAAIFSALNRIQKVGMVCNGFVSPSSAMAAEFMPILKQAHAYAFTSATSNPGYNGRTADTCDLHRFNIQATPLADIKQYIDDCITQDRIMTFYGHAAQFGTTYSGEEWNLEKVAAVIEYCIAKRDAGLLYVGGTDDCVKYFFDL